MSFGRVVNRLHHLGGDDYGIDMGGKLFARLNAVQECVDLVLEMIAHLEYRLILDQRAELRGVDRKVLAILQTDARLIAHKVNIHFVFADVLSPGAVERNDGALRTNHAGYRIVYIVYAVILRRSAVFLDNRMALLEHPLVGLVLCCLEVAAKRWRREDVLRVIKNPLLAVNQSQQEAFEIYAEAFDLKGPRRFGQPFTRPCGEVDLEEAEQARQRLAAEGSPLLIASPSS